MEKYLVNLINQRNFNEAGISALLIYIHENGITNADQLYNNLLEKYLNMDEESGYLYCVYHYSFVAYGNDTYKLGRTMNIKNRLNQYVTCFLGQVQVVHLSELTAQCKLAETILFKKLKEKRVEKNREFFKLELDIIKSTIDEVVHELNAMKIIDIITKYNIYNKQMHDFKSKIVEFINTINGIKHVLNCNLDGKSFNTHKCAKYKLVNEINQERIQDLLKADKDSEKYDEIKLKSDKTLHEQNIIVVQHIKTSFNLNSLNEVFLKDLNKVKNTEKFIQSQVYFLDENYEKKCIDKYKDTKFNTIVDKLFKKTKLLKDCIGLFWKDGLMSNNEIIVPTGEESLTEEQTVFIEENGNETMELFNSYNQKKLPKYGYQLLKLLNDMITDYFAGFIKLDISDQKSKRCKGGKRLVLYNVSIQQKQYIELISNKNAIYLLNIPTHILKTNCKYSQLHGSNTIEELYLNKRHDHNFIDPLIPQNLLY